MFTAPGFFDFVVDKETDLVLCWVSEPDWLQTLLSFAFSFRAIAHLPRMKTLRFLADLAVELLRLLNKLFEDEGVQVRVLDSRDSLLNTCNFLPELVSEENGVDQTV